MMQPPMTKQSSTKQQLLQAESNEDYEAALMTNMMQKMKSSIVQKMMGVVEQERALLMEQ